MTEASLNQTQLMGLGDWLMLALLGAIWGCSYFFIGVAVTELPPLTIVAARVVLAGATLWCVVAVARIPVPRSAEAFNVYLVMGLINNAAPFTLIIWAQTHIASGLAGILVATTPLFGVVLAGLTLSDERMTPLRLVGAAVGFAGVMLVIGVEALSGAAGQLVAIFACLTGACCFAVSGIFGRRFAALGINPLVAATAQVDLINSAGSDCTHCRSVLDPCRARGWCDGGGASTCDWINRIGIHPLFPSVGVRGCDECLVGQFPYSDPGHRAWSDGAWRNNEEHTLRWAGPPRARLVCG